MPWMCKYLVKQKLKEEFDVTLDSNDLGHPSMNQAGEYVL